MAEAAVYIVKAPVNMPDLAQLTDEQGQFMVPAPVPGLYTLGARSDEWGPVQTEVEVSGTEPVTIELKFSFH